MWRELRTRANDTILTGRAQARGVALEPQLTLIHEAGLLKVFNAVFEPSQGLVLEVHTVNAKRVRYKLGQLQLWGNEVGRVRK